MQVKNYLFLALLSLMVACSKSPTVETNFYKDALPHQLAAIESDLSEIDLQKLAHAKGKTVEPIKSADLTKIIQSASGRLFLFSFWTKDCTECTDQLQQLEALFANQEEEKFQLIFVNLDDKTALAEVNLFIRQNGISARSFWLENKEDEQWKNLLSNKWQTNHPFLLMVQNEEGILMAYEKPLQTEELFSLIQPFFI